MQHVGGIVFINLDHRKDRLQNIERQLDRFRTCESTKHLPIVRIPAQRCSDGTAGGEGVIRSHMAAIDYAKEHQWKSVLIFEDDFAWEPRLLQDFSHDVIEPLETFWNSYHETFGFVQLAHSGFQRSVRISPQLHQVFASTNAAGYWVHQRAYEPLIELWRAAAPLMFKTNHHWLYMNDVVWNRLRDRFPCFAFEPRFGYQIEGFSDNSGRHEPAK